MGRSKELVFWMYRKAIAKELHRRLSPDWSYKLCWSYSRCYDLFFDDRWQSRNFSDIEQDVTDEMSSWDE